MKIEFRTVERTVPHCGDCAEVLSGNGSLILPYRCECGDWEYDSEKGEYSLNK